jgi:hypothetical protein
MPPTRSIEWARSVMNWLGEKGVLYEADPSLRPPKEISAGFAESQLKKLLGTGGVDAIKAADYMVSGEHGSAARTLLKRMITGPVQRGPEKPQESGGTGAPRARETGLPRAGRLPLE